MNISIICLDAEFADNEELLELSLFGLDGKEIYHCYYRPEMIDDWRTDIHHITPEMVADKQPFSEVKGEVQHLLDEAYALTGFAVDNDLRVLTRSGISGLDDKRVIDVKDMYWYQKGRAEEMSPFAVPSLIVCANALGLDFSEATAHSASADTEATLKCFNLLLNSYIEGKGKSDAAEEDVDAFINDINDARALFVQDSARGYVKVGKYKEYHKVYFGKSSDSGERTLLFEVEVADRYKAEYELRKLLKKKEVPGKHNLYKLTPKQLDDIRRYKNEYNAEDSAWCKKILRNLSRLTL